MKLVERKQYLDKLKDALGTPDIKVIMGVYGSGKSELIEVFKNYIEQNIVNCNIIYINFDTSEYECLSEYHSLYDYVNSKYNPEKENFVLIDEVQMCSGFEKALNGLHASEKYDIYITSSNSFLSNSDLSTLFTGRTFEVNVYPFSFSEFMQYFDCSDRYDAFDRYFFEGGMAGSYLYEKQESKYDYIMDVFNTLIVRDIRQKYKLRNVQLMDRIVDYLMDNVSNLTSARNIVNVLNVSDEKANHVTVSNYMQYLCNAFAFYKVRRYDIRGKKYLSTNDKYYLCDHAIRYAKLGTKNMDYGRILENIVAMELFRRGYEVYVGVLHKKEIDFVAIKRNEKIYIQVSDNISDEDTFRREVDPLLAIKDAYPKIVVARTKHDEYQYEGVKIIDIADWLLTFQN